MKYADEFRNPGLIKNLLQAIAKTLQFLESSGRARKTIRIMEFCGGHTHTMFKYGIEELLPRQSSTTIQMVHGPGCPVCVLPMSRVDECLAIARRPDVTLCSFGDALRVNGMHGSLLDAKAHGADVRIVYSPLDALNIALQETERQVVFFALGFETTMPSTALTVLQAERQKVGNFSLFCNHILTAPTIQALLQDPDIDLDGFVAPGHVAMVIGLDDFQFVSRDYHKPLVVSGFEPGDILQSIYMVLRQLAEGRSSVENQYKRVVRFEGNKRGREAIAQVYMPHPVTELRGFGEIGNAGVCLRPAYRNYDASQRFGSKENLPAPDASEPQTDASQTAMQEFQELLRQSRCGDVLKGMLEPIDCPLYGKECLPQSPVGALMVSSEGSCAAYYQHGIRHKRAAESNLAQGRLVGSNA